MTELISIIVPFYNAERYIGKCLESIRRQSCASFECIMINDGSSDQSADIAEDFCAKDGRFRLIHQKNNGVSESRNNGMRAAKGKYLFFIDSDDYLEEDALQSLLDAVTEQDSDVAMSDIFFDRGDRCYVPFSHSKGMVSRDEALISLYNDTWTRPVVWGKLYKKELIDKYNLSFDARIQYSEDILFLTEVLLHAEKITYINAAAYHYYLSNTASAMNSVNGSRTFQTKWLSKWTAYEQMESLLIQNQAGKVVIDEFRASRVELARDMMRMEMKCDQSEIQEFREQLQYERKYLPIYLRVRKRKLPSKILTVLNAVSPRLEYRIGGVKH